MRTFLLPFLLVGSLLLSLTTFVQAAEPDLRASSRIQLPKGFKISLYANGLPSARSMALGDKGTLFVGSRKKGNVYAVVDIDGDYKADKKYLIAKNLNTPSGIAFREGSLYVAEINRVIRYDNIESLLDTPPEPVVIRDDLPKDRHHGWKYIAFGPDDKLYIPVGGPCNVCDNESDDPRYASICRMNADGSEFEVFAHGVRNSVGFTWHPETEELWFTDNGRDMLGDDIPPDELNNAPKAGMHFGFPFCHGGDIPDPDFDYRPCSEFTPPAQKLGPHVASLGVKFYTGTQFPEKYRNNLFIAEHGSWNRTDPIGYRITRVVLEDNKAVSYSVFAGPFRKEDEVSGRPVDLLVMPDGSMLVSDDYGGKIFRISYRQ